MYFFPNIYNFYSSHFSLVNPQKCTLAFKVTEVNGTFNAHITQGPHIESHKNLPQFQKIHVDVNLGH